MKRIGYTHILTALFLILPGQLISQNCGEHHREGDCPYDIQIGWQILILAKEVPVWVVLIAGNIFREKSKNQCQ